MFHTPASYPPFHIRRALKAQAAACGLNLLSSFQSLVAPVALLARAVLANESNRPGAVIEDGTVPAQAGWTGWTPNFRY